MYKTIGSDTTKWTISQRPREKSPTNVPPIGYYEIERSASQTKEKSRTAYIKPLENEMPPREKSSSHLGPGSYDTHKNFGEDKPVARICSRPLERPKDYVPGPGDYENNSLKVRKSRSPVVNFSKVTSREKSYETK